MKVYGTGEESNRLPEPGDAVIYHDEYGEPHNALVTISWGVFCCNLLYVSDIEKMQDQYGRQTIRESSVSHKSSNGTAHGRYFRWTDEEPNMPVAPISK